MLKPDAYTLTSEKISGYSKQRQDYHLNKQQFSHAVYLFRDTQKIPVGVNAIQANSRPKKGDSHSFAHMTDPP